MARSIDTYLRTYRCIEDQCEPMFRYRKIERPNIRPLPVN